MIVPGRTPRLIGIAASSTASTRYGRVEVGDLAGRLDVAPETIRRDLRQLEGQGLLQRVHGGAVRRSRAPAVPVRRNDTRAPAAARPAGRAGGRTPARPRHRAARRLATHLGGGRVAESAPTGRSRTHGRDDQPRRGGGALPGRRTCSVYNIGGSVEPAAPGPAGRLGARRDPPVSGRPGSGVSLRADHRRRDLRRRRRWRPPSPQREIEIAARVWVLIDGKRSAAPESSGRRTSPA